MDFSIPHLLYEEDSFGVFLLITAILGGGAAWLTGRAIAATWRPLWQAGAYMLPLGGVTRFFHYALFDGTLLTLQYYLVDCAVLVLFALAGFQTTRVAQMVRQYRWINEHAGPMRWRRKAR